MSGFKFCPNCGAENIGRPFCPNCGEKYPDVSLEASTQVSSANENKKGFSADEQTPKIIGGVKIKKKPDFNFDDFEPIEEILENQEPAEDLQIHSKSPSPAIKEKELDAEEEAQEMKKPFWAKLEKEKAPSVNTKSISYKESDKFDKEGVYNPNYDKYYDDVLPEVVNEINRFPKEAIIKISTGIVLIIGAILYCVYVM